MSACLGVLITLLFAATCYGPTSGVNVTKKFHLVTTFKANWFRALHHCVANGMRLASILSQEENDELVTQIKHSGFIDLFWLAGTSHGFEPNFYWMGQNKAIGYTNWIAGEPNYPEQEQCVHIWADKDYKWNDWICSNQIYFVCEEDIEQ